jgi:hypothetical protein
MTTLIALSTLPGGTNVEAKMNDIPEAARASMNRAVKAMSVVDFSDAVLSMIESGEQRVRVTYSC